MARQTDKRYGLVRGHSINFIVGHRQSGALSPQWKGGRSIRQDGYTLRLAHGHPREDGGGYVLEHILIAEAALGNPLPPGVVVHHTDEQRGQIDPRGLVICPNNNYHQLLHQRSRALDACGHADWRKCTICKQYDPAEKLYIFGSHVRHRACMTRESAIRRGKAMLREIQSRIGPIDEFAAVVREIDAYFESTPESRAAETA